MSQVQDISYEHRFQASNFDQREREIIIGALNRYGVSNPAPATSSNLSIFTWSQVEQALIMSRSNSLGESRDDVDDVIYNVKSERKSYVH